MTPNSPFCDFGFVGFFKKNLVSARLLLLPLCGLQVPEYPANPLLPVSLVEVPAGPICIFFFIIPRGPVELHVSACPLHLQVQTHPATVGAHYLLGGQQEHVPADVGLSPVIIPKQVAAHGAPIYTLPDSALPRHCFL